MPTAGRALRLRRGRQPDRGATGPPTTPARTPRARALRRHPHHPRRQRPLRTRRPRPHHPPPEDPALPQTGHLALHLGRRGPPDGGHHSGRHPLAVPVRPTGPTHRQTAAGCGRKHRRSRWTSPGTARLFVNRQPIHRIAEPGHPHLGPPGPAPHRPNRTHHSGRRSTRRNRPAILQYRHRPRRQSHLTHRRTGRHRLANPHHALGHDRVGTDARRTRRSASPASTIDPETGLHYNYFRHYDPETARYATPDPLGLSPAPNPATYVSNPHTWSDPLGLGPCPDNVALGTRKEGDLRNYAESRNYTHFLDQSQEGALSSVRNAAHEQPHVRLHVTLDGFRGLKDQVTDNLPELFEAAYMRGKGDNWYTTEREMAIVGDSVKWENRTWDSISFYYKGNDVTARIPRPDFLGG